MTKFYDAVYSFERVGGYQFVKLWVTAMAAGGEKTRSAHARDVSLGARILRGSVALPILPIDREQL